MLDGLSFAIGLLIGVLSAVFGYLFLVLMALRKSSAPRVKKETGKKAEQKPKKEDDNAPF